MAITLDTTSWRPIHTRILLALGVGWALDSFEVQIIGSLIQPIAKQFHLSTNQQTVDIWVVWFAGLLVGALGFGYLADRVGRKKLFVLTLVIYSVAAVLTASSVTFAMFLFFRFLTAMGVGGEYSAVTSAITELVPVRRRGRAISLVMNFWSVGGIVAGLVGIFVLSALLSTVGWRGALVIGALAAMYGLYVRRLIPESPRFLASRGRLAEADRVLREVGAEGGSAELVTPGARNNLFAQLGELWRHYRWRLLYGMVLDFSGSAAYYGIFTFLPVFVLVDGVVAVKSSTVPWFYLIANIGALIGGFVVAGTLDRFGRRPVVFWSYFIASVSAYLLAVAAHSHSPGWTLAAFTFAVFCATCSWMSTYPTFAELFPTHLRATGIGASVGFGRIGGMVGVVVLALLAPRFGLNSSFLVLALLFLLGAGVAALWWWRGTEARGLTLEEMAPLPAPVTPEPVTMPS
jgi:MFS family permease